MDKNQSASISPITEKNSLQFAFCNLFVLYPDRRHCVSLCELCLKFANCSCSFSAIELKPRQPAVTLYRACLQPSVVLICDIHWWTLFLPWAWKQRWRVHLYPVNTWQHMLQVNWLKLRRSHAGDLFPVDSPHPLSSAGSSRVSFTSSGQTDRGREI